MVLELFSSDELIENQLSGTNLSKDENRKVILLFFEDETVSIQKL